MIMDEEEEAEDHHNQDKQNIHTFLREKGSGGVGVAWRRVGPHTLSFSFNG